jgi:ketosteroid isomerase-like protein
MKQSRLALSVLVTTLALLFGFGLAQEEDAEALEIVNGITQQYVDAVNKQDAEAFSQFWTEDAQDLQYNVPVVEGVEAILENQGFAPENVGTFELSAEATEAMLSGDLAYGQGTFNTVDAEGQVLDEGKWVAIYKKQDGSWKLHRLIANSNLPLPEAAASDSTMSGGGN